MSQFADKWLKPTGAIIVTLFTGLVLMWWLLIVRDKIGATPRLDVEGNVILDEWQRAKDILLVVVPLFTAAMGYWIGSKESATATEKADKAADKAGKAEEKVAALSGALGPAEYEALRTKYTNLF